MAKKANKVLVVSYYWLPFSGTGTYRISKFVKYLIKEGWEPIILTPEKAASPFKEEETDPIYEKAKVYTTKILEPTHLFNRKASPSQNVTNASFFLSKDLSLKQKVIRWIRLNLFIPDAKVLWKRFAVQKGKEVIEKEQPDIILSTSPPPTAHLVAKQLAKWSNLKWIADFRDPWTNIFYYEKLPINPLSKWINKSLERKVLEAADKVITVSNDFFPGQEQDSKYIRIENGFDPDDMPAKKADTSRNEKFTIRYIGSLKNNQFFQTFFEVLKDLSKEEEFRQNLKFETAGYVDPSIQEYINREIPNLEINSQGYIPHTEAIQQMNGADLLILAIGKGKQSKNVISTKIFEYLMVGKPILAFGHIDGTANTILEETEGGKMFQYEDYKGPKKFLLDHYAQWKGNNTSFSPDIEKIQPYNFQHLTQKLIDLLNTHLS